MSGLDRKDPSSNSSSVTKVTHRMLPPRPGHCENTAYAAPESFRLNWGNYPVQRNHDVATELQHLRPEEVARGSYATLARKTTDLSMARGSLQVPRQSTVPTSCCKEQAGGGGLLTSRLGCRPLGGETGSQTRWSFAGIQQGSPSATIPSTAPLKGNLMHSCRRKKVCQRQ